MKFRKTFLAVAVAGVAAAPLAASADTTLSGVIEIKVAGSDADGDDGDPSFQAGDVRAAILSEQPLNSGLTGYGNIQFNLDDLSSEGGPDATDIAEDVTELDDTPDLGGATISSDEIYVGVKGDFGDLRFGEIPLSVEYGQLANDIYDIGAEVPGGAAYTGNFGAVTTVLNFSPEQDSDMVGAGVKFNLAGFAIGLGFEDRGENLTAAVGAGYTIAGFSLNAHYYGIDLDADDILEQDADGDGDEDDDDGLQINTPDADRFGYAVKAGYGIGDVSLAVTYAADIIDDGDEPESTTLRLDIGYDLGGGLNLSTRIQDVSADAGYADFDGDAIDEQVEYRVQLAKVF